MKRDSQRSKVYAWENAASWNGKNKNELDELQLFLQTEKLMRQLKLLGTLLLFLGLGQDAGLLYFMSMHIY